ncbi:hypothetical protein [Halarcobacter bivalviorum]|uniref:Uncharacterized protein n=1 Tax=Halarcobacter bivalviorum TaxID=663364 RepID=A0AAX2AAC1_9BACT|nr:hypothetical protein [Halarcobacter bivalviorum]AXH11956.1 hypothetical protein ABIV_0949 [Halarcobacter bivalviorum]RXK11073.1 hypothetical protein CRV05_01520 [Halarcobacter bivalviorum]
MDMILGILGGGLIGLLITHFYYKKAQKDSYKENEKTLAKQKKDSEEKVKRIKENNEINLKIIKEEFKVLNEQVKKIDTSKLPEKEKTEIITIRSEISKWAKDLSSDISKTETKLKMKLNERLQEEYKNSNIIREYVIYCLDLINDIILSFNNSNNKCYWNKPVLDANLFNTNTEVEIFYNEEVFVSLNLKSSNISTNSFLITLYIFDKDDLYKLNSAHLNFLFIVNSNNDIKVSIISDKLKVIDNEYDIAIENYQDIFNKKLKEFFEYVLVRVNNKID